MTNFDLLQAYLQLSTFADVAISAEKILQIDPAACALNCRRAMEFAVKWTTKTLRIATLSALTDSVRALHSTLRAI